MKTTPLKLILVSFLFFSIPIKASAISQTESDAARILMLEKALAAQTPEAVAAQFAKANQDRNGAVQYMLFSDQLKKKYKDAWPYWVSGTSSPWITSYTVRKMKQNTKSSQFEITYQWATADGPFHPALVQIVLIEPVMNNSNSSQKFWVTQINE